MMMIVLADNGKLPLMWTDIPFTVALIVIVLYHGVRNHMNSYLWAREKATYGWRRQREMVEHYVKLKGEDTNYRFYRAARIALPLLIVIWAALTWFFRLHYSIGAGSELHGCFASLNMTVVVLEVWWLRELFV